MGKELRVLLLISIIATLIVSFCYGLSTIRTLKETVAIQKSTIQVLRETKITELANELTGQQSQETKLGFTSITVFGFADELETGDLIRVQLKNNQIAKGVKTRVISREDAGFRFYWCSFEVPNGTYIVSITSKLGTVSETRSTNFSKKIWWQFDLNFSNEPNLKAVTL